MNFSHTSSVVKEFFDQIKIMMETTVDDDVAIPPPPVSYSLKTLFLPVADGADFQVRLQLVILNPPFNLFSCVLRA